MTYPSFTAGEVLRAADMNAVGLWRVGGGALSGSTTDFVGCFTSDYTNYRIIIDAPQISSAGDIYFRLLNGTSPVTGNYYWVSLGANILGTIQNAFSAGVSNEGYTGWTTTSGGAGTDTGGLSFDIQNPFVAKRTIFTGSFMSYQTDWKHGTTTINHGVQTAYSGLRITTLTAASLTGNVSIYGYRKA